MLGGNQSLGRLRERAAEPVPPPTRLDLDRDLVTARQPASDHDERTATCRLVHADLAAVAVSSTKARMIGVTDLCQLDLACPGLSSHEQHVDIARLGPQLFGEPRQEPGPPRRT